MLVKDKSENKMNIKNMCKISLNSIKGISSNYSKAFDLLLISLLIMTIVLVWVPVANGTFYNCNTDDVVQYYPYVANFFNRIKSGELSLYDVTLFGGASYFASTYYIPIDLFLGLAFILSNFLTVELSYYITLLLKIMCGAMILFYFLMRKGLKPTVCLIVGIIYTQTAVTEVSFVFPVYLGISFYAPLGMLLVDLFLTKKDRTKATITIPLYVLNCIIFDFYIAYMLVAFMCIFFVIEYSVENKGFFLIKKDFWISLITFLALIFIGLALAAAYLLPSALYIMNESSRTTSSTDYFWFYSVDHKTGENISFRHYFTQLVNYFIPNNPFRLCLISTGDYIREHGTLYMTSGALIYLFYFFTLRGWKNHKLKMWVGFMNIIYLIPICSMILSLSTWAYLRWFFMPYLVNLYAAAIGMDKSNYATGKNKILSTIPIVAMIFGFVLLMYTVTVSPVEFIHYQKESQGATSQSFFYGILITELIFIGIYLLLLIIPYVLNFFKINIKFIPRLMPFVVALEVIFSAIITFCSLGSTNYSEKYEEGLNDVNYAKNTLGYKTSDGYRINLYTSQRSEINANIRYGNVNPTNFFQSFYNTPLNVYYADIHKQTSTSWTRRSIYGYSLINGPMFNMKYFITSADITEVKLPNKYYTLYKNPDDTSLNYYVLKDSQPFIVYDEAFYPTVESLYTDSFENDLLLLESGYVKLPTEYYSLQDFDLKDMENVLNAYNENDKTITDGINTYTLSKESISYMDSLKAVYDSGISLKTSSSKKIEMTQRKSNAEYYSVSLGSGTYENGYVTYDLTTLDQNTYQTLFSYDAIYLYSYASQTTTQSDYHVYFRDPDTRSLRPFHYNTYYMDTYNIKPSELLVRVPKVTTSKSIILYGFDYDTYDNFVSEQNEYENKDFSLDGSKMHISFTNNDSKTKIVKTGYAYSSDFELDKDSSNYKLINVDGGFLGVIVPDGVVDVNVNISFNPTGLKTGLKVTYIGIILYFSATAILFVYELEKRRKKGVFR